jgi:hypothetical protein
MDTQTGDPDEDNISEATYTPTTEEVRDHYEDGVWNSGLGEMSPRVGERFDRWLTAQLTTAKADAWDEGRNQCMDDSSYEGLEYTANPYRAETT